MQEVRFAYYMLLTLSAGINIFVTAGMANISPLHTVAVHPLWTRLLLVIVPLFILAYLVQPFRAIPHPDYALIKEQDYLYPSASHHAAITQLRPKRILIVGAGASGSAAAFFLRRAARVMEERIGVVEGRLVGEIVVVDKEHYVGGRELQPGDQGLWQEAPRSTLGTTGERDPSRLAHLSLSRLIEI
jgi:hypothetical protein